jgi:hypothetical protein
MLWRKVFAFHSYRSGHKEASDLTSPPPPDVQPTVRKLAAFLRRKVFLILF